MHVLYVFSEIPKQKTPTPLRKRRRRFASLPTTASKPESTPVRRLA